MNEDQANELKRLKAYFPYRICFAGIDPVTGEFVVRADYTKRAMNALLRKGWSVWVI